MITGNRIEADLDGRRGQRLVVGQAIKDALDDRVGDGENRFAISGPTFVLRRIARKGTAMRIDLHEVDCIALRDPGLAIHDRDRSAVVGIVRQRVGREPVARPKGRVHHERSLAAHRQWRGFQNSARWVGRPA